MTRLIASSFLSLALFLLASLTLVAGDAGRSLEKERADSADRADTAIAADELSLSPAETWRETTYSVIEELMKIFDEIESVEDVREVRPDVAAAFGKITTLAEKLAADTASLTWEERIELQTIKADMQNDPHFTTLNARATKAQAEMIKRSPEAAAELQKILLEEQMKAKQMTTTAFQKIMGESRPDAGLDTSAVHPFSTPGERFMDEAFARLYEIVAITDGVSTMKEVDGARLRIGAAIDTIVIKAQELQAMIPSMSSRERSELLRLYDDPRFNETQRQEKRARSELEARSPEAAEALEGFKMTEMMRLSQTLMTMLSSLGPAPSADGDGRGGSSIDSAEGSPIDLLKATTYTVIEEIVEINESIASVEDVEAARPRLAAAIKEAATTIIGLIQRSDALTAEQRSELVRYNQEMRNDPKIIELMSRSERAWLNLVEIDPEAAEQFLQMVDEEDGAWKVVLHMLEQRMSPPAETE